jgi:hypothetical protein
MPGEVWTHQSIGVSAYFYPVLLPRGEVIGLVVAGAGVLANALSSILGRHVNCGGHLEPLAVTVAGMGIGAAVLLVGGLAVQGLPPLHIDPLGDHPLAGGGEYGLCVHVVESHAAYPFGDGIEHYPQHGAVPDSPVGLGLPR